jgi:carboxypeptidase C (cathepsin A)
MVFIEQPCGVGFSYSDDKDDYKTGDAQAASDNYDLIQAFMTRFPEYRANDLYITSESYGGHYMPTLAQAIVNKNAELTQTDEAYLKFKGFAVGNPDTNVWSILPASLETFWGHQLVAGPIWNQYTTQCKEKLIPNVTLCGELFDQMYLQVGQNFNPYALDYPVCTEDSKAKYGRSQRNWLMRYVLQNYSDKVKKAVGLEPDSSYEPCEDDYMTSYLNQESVKKALHVNTDIEWLDCSRSIRYDQKDGTNSMVPIYQELINGTSGINILVYSGDDDSVCGTVGTQHWIWDMGYETSPKTFWRPYIVADQTAGFLTKWKDTNLAFLTIHGAGHEVPTYKPEAALDMFTKYLAGELTNGQ